jgi:hypothetical protein
VVGCPGGGGAVPVLAAGQVSAVAATGQWPCRLNTGAAAVPVCVVLWQLYRRCLACARLVTAAELPVCAVGAVLLRHLCTGADGVSCQLHVTPVGPACLPVSGHQLAGAPPDAGPVLIGLIGYFFHPSARSHGAAACALLAQAACPRQAG